MGAIETATITGSMEPTGGTILDSVTGADFELLMMQHDPEPDCRCIPTADLAIIGQCGGHCIGAVDSGIHIASDSNGSRRTAAKTPVDTNLCQNRI